MMINNREQSVNALFSLIENTNIKVSNLYPHQWIEANRVMTKEVSPIEGPMSFLNSPYVRGIVDCLDQRVPGHVFAVMKGAQIGMSTGLMEGGIGWIIANNPGNILFLVGHADLVPDAVSKIDTMIVNSGIKHLVGNKANKIRKTKSGDTDKFKEYLGGKLKIGTANHGTLRNFSVQYGFIDDYESMRGNSEQSGSTMSLIDQRFAAYSATKKLFYISTPELEDTSNIYAVYLLGDQRKYHVPCQCCGEKIVLEWDIQSTIDDTKCGIVWDLNDKSELIYGSVRYRCQLCNGEFDDSNKKDFLNAGDWIPTAVAKEKDYVSFHISSLYAPVYMDNWEKYVAQYLRACPPGGERNEEEYKTFCNLVLGIPYKVKITKLEAKQLMYNQRDYQIGIVPQSLSEMDGNGRIIMLTMGVDIGGVETDGRLDYEIVAWSESGSSYSISHGSIGTHHKGQSANIDRLRMPLDPSKPDNVWIDFENLIKTKFYWDSDDSKYFNIMSVSIDTGHYKDFAFSFYDYYNKQNNSFPKLFMVKGHPGAEVMKVGADVRLYDSSKEYPGRLYIVRTNVSKNQLAGNMSLKWNFGDDRQPSGFMNFPTPSLGAYSWTNFFAHFEAEEMRINKKLMYEWKNVKNRPNHQFDCRIYSIAAREMFVNEVIFKSMKLNRGTWADFVKIFTNKEN